jgi:hypothetical protein
MVAETGTLQTTLPERLRTAGPWCLLCEDLLSDLVGAETKGATMNIPWQFFGTLSAVSAILVLLGVYLGQRLIDNLERRVSAPFESAVKKAETLYEKQVDVGAQVDLDLRTKREPFYKDLWRLTGLLPRWPKADDVTYAKVLERSRECRDWFFNGGGLYLSAESRDAYGKVQEALSRLGRESDDVITEAEYKDTLDLFHLMRLELTTDLLSRSRLRDLSEAAHS